MAPKKATVATALSERSSRTRRTAAPAPNTLSETTLARAVTDAGTAEPKKSKKKAAAASKKGKAGAKTKAKPTLTRPGEEE
jgi:hypothetical protein